MPSWRNLSNVNAAIAYILIYSNCDETEVQLGTFLFHADT